MGTSGKITGKNLKVFLDNQGGTSFEITNYVKSVKGLPGQTEMADVTVPGAGYNFIPGKQKATIDIECVFDDTANSAYDIAKTYKSDTNSRSLLVYPAGNTSGYANLSCEMRISDLPMEIDVTNALIFHIIGPMEGGLTITTA